MVCRSLTCCPLLLTSPSDLSGTSHSLSREPWVLVFDSCLCCKSCSLHRSTWLRISFQCQPSLHSNLMNFFSLSLVVLLHPSDNSLMVLDTSSSFLDPLVLLDSMVWFCPSCVPPLIFLSLLRFSAASNPLCLEWPTIQTLNLWCQAPMPEAGIRKHWTSKPSPSKSSCTCLRTMPFWRLTSPCTFSPITNSGLISLMSLNISGQRYLLSSLPFCFPATLNG